MIIFFYLEVEKKALRSLLLENKIVYMQNQDRIIVYLLQALKIVQ